ncbi:MAG: hypothetical protein HKN79_02540 [Flavobacteriales bacterium]|nr:hypothetical protein [Flavobacteriales bacterium]
MKRRLPLLGLLLLGLSCDLINPNEEEVSFLRIEEIGLEVRNGGIEEGSPSEKIIDVWLNVNDELIGAYEMPVDIPILNQGPVDIKIFGGIQINGLSTERTRYPFYDFYNTEIELIPGASVTLEPTLNYIADVLVFNNEDFEGTGFQFERSVTSDTIMESIPNPDPSDVLQGDKIGALYLDEERDHFKVNSTLELDLAFKNIAYIELDYKVEGPFTVGLRRSQPSILDYSIAGFNPSLDENGQAQWNHVYVELNQAIDLLGNEDEYEIFIEGYNTGMGVKTYYFDNVKVIHPLQ